MPLDSTCRRQFQTLGFSIKALQQEEREIHQILSIDFPQCSIMGSVVSIVFDALGKFAKDFGQDPIV